MSVGREALAHATSGAIGSMISLAVFYPLDLIRHFQQG
jgi:hypothetical protein